MFFFFIIKAQDALWNISKPCLDNMHHQVLHIRGHKIESLIPNFIILVTTVITVMDIKK